MSAKAARDRAPDALSPGTQGPDAGAPAPATGFAPDDFASFLNDVATVVAQNVAPWKQQLAEASNKWGALGYAVAVLERALARDKTPNVEGLLATYAAAVEYLRQLEAQAGAIDPSLVGSPAFRDPERVALAEAELGRLLPPGPDATMTRAALEVTASNSSAAAASDEVVAKPGAEHCPLYVHGPGGSGRTHLLSATAAALRSWRSGRVAYVTGARFADELAAAVRENTVERWRARYLPLDVLAVDDVHAVAGNARAEQELALVCATLREGGRQVLLAGDTAPAALPDALRKQVERGRAVGLEAADRELCARLLARHFSAAGRDVAPDVISYLAERAGQSLQGLAAVADRLLAAADRASVPLTLPFARAELGQTPTRSAATGGATPEAARSVAFFLDVEKVVWDWPDVTGRLIEEMR